jgi:hypothetical protein
MSSNNINDDRELDEIKEEKYYQRSIIYSIMHLIISLFAVYLSWKCNEGFSIVSFICALICPYLYILWALATRGGCGVFESNCNLVIQP